MPQNKYDVCRDLVRPGYILKQIIVAAIAGSTNLSYGLHSGWISPVQKVLQSDVSPAGRPLSDSEMSWVATFLTTSAAFGVFLHIYTADAFGRKISLISVLILQGISWIILLISSQIGPLLAARACAGVGSAGSFIVVPMYIKEISQANIRGTLVTLCLSSQYVGILAVYLMGGYLNYSTTIWICASFSIMSTLLVIIVCPETPPFLVKKGYGDKARVVVANLRGLNAEHKTVQDEMKYMVSQDEYFKSIPNIKFITIFKNKAWLRAYLLCFFILSGIGFNGCIGIVTYAYSIITQCGVSLSPELQTLSVPILMLIGTVVPLTCADKFGRKPLLAGTLLLSTAGLALLASFLLLKKNELILPSSVPVIAIATTVCAYAMGVMPMAHVIMSEMFRFEVRAKLIGCIIGQLWVLASVQVAFCDFMSRAIGLHGVFYIFAAVNLATALFVTFFVPETKGKTVEQLEDILIGKKDDSIPL